MKTVIMAALLAASPAFAQTDDAPWYPSTYGAEDEIGAANLLTPENVLSAKDLITTGKTYALGVPVGRNTPGFGSRELDFTIMMPGQEGGRTLGSNAMSYVDDMIVGWVGLGSQIDGLGHLGIDNHFYNGNTPEDYVATTGLTKMGIHNVPPIVGRGVLLDMAKLRGTDVVAEGELFTLEEVQQAVSDAGLTLSSGDIVLFHTGWLSVLEDEPQRFAGGEPGIDATSAAWLAEQGVVAVGADTWGLDVVPHPDGTLFTAHQELLAKNGVYILEVMDTSGLAADGVTDFFFVLGQPRFEGAVQAFINPIAIK
ncbi:kynurenine formamidase [Sagittula marina]|uniref:Kynurenine formamidase n=1 Tax=Sagittula marina TaxID=943940 RepID=A0A7W6DSP9_9RHOB|nr:cyclase family protein [Sagittula marina]MBB3988282.1 kynurenine formamidase [Sagittula marina]